MAIQITGTTVIDDNYNVKNIETINAGIITTTTIDADEYSIQNLPILPIDPSIGSPITFTVELGGVGRTGQDSFQCSNGQSYTCYGSTISALITARTADEFSFGSGSSTTLFINNDWIMTAGHAGSFGVSYYRSTNCNQLSNGGDAQGLAAIGEDNYEVQGTNVYYEYGPNFATLAGGGGAGCPRGANGTGSNGGDGGYCQTRPRAEYAGNEWNNITVKNVSVSAGTNIISYFKITYNGVTKTFQGSSSGSTKLEDLLTW